MMAATNREPSVHGSLRELKGLGECRVGFEASDTPGFAVFGIRERQRATAANDHRM
jgi:hypothetical protein